ncbi:hypothetical protein ACWGMA_48245 [Streptomyces asiaticus]
MAVHSGLPDGTEGLEKAGADVEQWADRVEGGLAQMAGDQRIGHVQRQGHQAGEHQQPTCRTQFLCVRAVEGQVPDAQEQAEDG